MLHYVYLYTAYYIIFIYYTEYRFILYRLGKGESLSVRKIQGLRPTVLSEIH